MFDPQLVPAGRMREQWRRRCWRWAAAAFAFPHVGEPTNPIWLIFFAWYVYYVMTALEGTWGEGPLTIFVFLSYVSALGASVVAQRPLNIWLYVIENVSLAFGTLFPDIEFYLFFILPVKAKWLALFAGGMLLLDFVSGDIVTKLFPGGSYVPLPALLLSNARQPHQVTA